MDFGYNQIDVSSVTLPPLTVTTMSRLIIIGDSNIYRNITAINLTKRVNRPSNILHATRLSTLEVAIKAVTPECELLVVSALSNILCDEYGQVAPSEEQLTAFMDKHVDFVSSAPSVSTLILPPFHRQEPTWFGPLVPKLRLLLVKSALRHKHVTILPEFKVMQLDLIKDGVHLGSDTGARLFNFLVSCILDLQNPEQSTSSQARTTSNEAAPESISDVMQLIRNEVLPLLGDVPTNKDKVPSYSLIVVIFINAEILILHLGIISLSL